MEINSSEWSGFVFIKARRVLFVGEAGTSTDQNVHAIKICIALSGNFELSTASKTKGKKTQSSKTKGKPYSAVIINAGIEHTVRSARTEIFLLYLLPETEEGRAIQQEYLSGGEGKKELTKEEVERLLPLQEVLHNYQRWNCGKAFQVCDEVVRALGVMGEKELLSASDLSKELSFDVRVTIEDIYEQFKPSLFAGKPGWKPTPPKRDSGKRRRFTSQVGISIDRYFNDILLLAVLAQYATREKERQKKEKKLFKALQEYGIKQKDEREKINTQLKKIARKTQLNEIAGVLGITLTNLGHRIHSRLGINFHDLQEGSDFFPCDKDDTKI